MDQARETFLRMRYWPSLDGLRALAIIPVVWHHVGGYRGGIWARGPLGVELFFAISGYLITSLLLRERRATGGISLRGFYIRRSLRIFPLYYAVLAVYVVVVLVMEGHSEAGRAFMANLLPYATYTSNWFVQLDGRVIFYFAWSLACEEQFYLLWPSIVRFTRPLAAAAVMGAILVALQFAPATVRLATPICMGCLAALAVDSSKGFTAAHGVLGRRWMSPLVLVAVAACVAFDPPLLVTGLAMTALVVACTLRKDHLLQPVLEWRPLRYVGEISYGMYLMHVLVVNVVRRLVPHHDALVFVVALAGVIVVAGASHRWFERPVLALKDRMGARAPVARPDPAAAR